MHDPSKNLEQVLQDMTFDDVPDIAHRDLLEQKLLHDFNAVHTRHEFKWRTIMSAKATKFAAAAVILMGVLVGLRLFKETSNEIWAQVRDQVAAVHAVIYQAKVNGTAQGQPFQFQIKAILADEHGTRMDTYMDGELVERSFTLADTKTHISIFPAQKKYIEVALTEKDRIENGDPKLIVESFLKSDYQELGRREVNGVTLEGIQSADVSPTAGFPGGAGLMEALKGLSAKVTACLWVDVATGWPVEMTLDLTDRNGGEKTTIVVSDFQWDAQIDPTAFASIIPAGYQLMYQVNAEHLEEGNQLIEGLGYFAQISDGKYPAKLSIREVVGEIGDIYRAKSGDPSFRIDDAKVSTLKYAAQYFGTLQTEDRDPVYKGQTVTAADTDKILLRWKLDNGQYRVIFGDLRIQDVSPVELTQLEAQ